MFTCLYNAYQLQLQLGSAIFAKIYTNILFIKTAIRNPVKVGVRFWTVQDLRSAMGAKGMTLCL